MDLSPERLAEIEAEERARAEIRAKLEKKPPKWYAGASTPIVIILAIALLSLIAMVDENPASDIHSVGVTLELTQSAMCATRAESLKEMAKWGRLNDRLEMGRIMVRDGSEILPPGTHVKIISTDGGNLRLIRVIRAEERVCWTVLPR